MEEKYSNNILLIAMHRKLVKMYEENKNDEITYNGLSDQAQKEQLRLKMMKKVARFRDLKQMSLEFRTNPSKELESKIMEKYAILLMADIAMATNESIRLKKDNTSSLDQTTETIKEDDSSISMASGASKEIKLPIKFPELRKVNEDNRKSFEEWCNIYNIDTIISEPVSGASKPSWCSESEFCRYISECQYLENPSGPRL